MTPEEIRKCKKDGYVWVSDDEAPYQIRRDSGGTRWKATLRQINKPCLHPTRAAAQAAIDERKSVESHETQVGEPQADPEPMKWAKRLDGEIVQDGDDIYTGIPSIDLQAPSVSPACGSQNINWEKAIALKGRRVGEILLAGHKIMARYLAPEWKAWKERHDAKAKSDTTAYPPKAKQEADGWTQEEIDKPAPKPSVGSKYDRKIHGVDGGSATVDVYNVLEAFGVTCPSCQHAIKKLLCAGLRNKGSRLQDLSEAAESTRRAVTLERQRSQNENS